MNEFWILVTISVNIQETRRRMEKSLYSGYVHRKYVIRINETRESIDDGIFNFNFSIYVYIA